MDYASKRKMLVLVVLISVAVFIAVLSYNLIRPKFTIVLDDQADPTTTQVRVDNKILEPSGPGGSEYTARIFVGKREISVKGQYIVEQVEHISVGIGGQKIEKRVARVDLDSIVKKAMDQDGIVVTNARVFHDLWIVAYVKNAKEKDKDGRRDYPILMRYDISKSSWELGSLGSTPWTKELPKEVKSYYGDQNED